MTRIVVDTNVISALFGGNETVAQRLAEYSDIILPFAVVAELLSGYKYGTLYEKNKKIIDNFLDEAAVSIAYPDSKTVEIYSDFYAFLRKQGTPIPINDIWIAATAYQLSEKLYTFDTDFNNLPQLLIVR